MHSLYSHEDNQLPSHDFYKGAKLLESERDMMLADMHSPYACIFPELFPQVPDDFRNFARLWELCIEIWVWTQLRLSLAQRRGAAEKIAILSKEHLSKLSASSNESLPENFFGQLLPFFNEIHIFGELSLAERYNVLRHEMIHGYAYKCSSICETAAHDKTPILRRFGYLCQTGKAHLTLNFLNEAITELLHIEVWKDALIRDYVQEDFFAVGYEHNIFVLESLIQTSAKNLHIADETVLFALYKGYFDGTTDGLRMLHRGLSTGTLQSLAKLDAYQPDLEALCHTLGKDVYREQVIEKMKRYINGEIQEVLSHSIRKSQNE